MVDHSSVDICFVWAADFQTIETIHHHTLLQGIREWEETFWISRYFWTGEDLNLEAKDRYWSRWQRHSWCLPSWSHTRYQHILTIQIVHLEVEGRDVSKLRERKDHLSDYVEASKKLNLLARDQRDWENQLYRHQEDDRAQYQKDDYLLLKYRNTPFRLLGCLTALLYLYPSCFQLDSHFPGFCKWFLLSAFHFFQSLPAATCLAPYAWCWKVPNSRGKLLPDHDEGRSVPPVPDVW